MKIGPQIADFERDMDLDFAYAVPGLSRYRVHVFLDDRGIGAAFRIIPEDIKSIDDLMLPVSLNRFASCSSAMTVIIVRRTASASCNP